MRTSRVASSVGRQEKLIQNQNVPDDRDDSVRTNRPVAGWPRKHQYTEDRHQFIGPNQSSQAEDKVQLHNDVED